MSVMAGIVEVDFRIDRNNAIQGVHKLLDIIRPHWKQNAKIERLTGGQFNDIYKSWTCGNDNDVILVRIFSPTSEVAVNHEKEYTILKKLTQNNVCMQLYAKFQNGYAYKYEHGATLKPHQLIDEDIYKPLIAMFHALHSTDTSHKDLSSTCLSFLKNAAETVNSPKFDRIEKLERFQKMVTSKASLLAEMQASQSVYDELCNNFDMVICHCDAHPHNIVHNPQTEAGVEFAFNEELETKWLTHYLDTHPKYGANNGTVAADVFTKWKKGLYQGMYLCGLIDVMFSLSVLADADQPEVIDALFRHGEYHAEIRMKALEKLKQLEI